MNTVATEPDEDSAPPGGPARQQRLLGAISWTAFAIFGAWFAARLIPNLVLRLQFEDQLIVLRYARNLAEGNGLVYNVSERVMGFTTPLFTVLSSVFVVLGGDQAAAWQNGFGLLCMLGTAALAARLLVRLGAGPAAPLAVALVTFNPPSPTTTSTWGWRSISSPCSSSWRSTSPERSRHGRRGHIRAAVPDPTEGALLAAMLIAHRWLRERKPPLRQAVAALAVALPWLLVSLGYYGGVLPKTLGAKEGESIVSAWRYLDLVREAYVEAGSSLLAAYSPSLAGSVAGPLLLSGLLLAGAAALLRRRPDLWPLIAFPLGALLGYAAIGSLPGYTWHYYSLNILCAFLLATGCSCRSSSGRAGSA